MSSTSPPPPEQQPAAKPGKIRTWWHPLLANLLRWQLGEHYHLEEEVPVGQKPLQIDILLLQKEQGELPASARRILAGLVGPEKVSGTFPGINYPERFLRPFLARRCGCAPE